MKGERKGGGEEDEEARCWDCEGDRCACVCPRYLVPDNSALCQPATRRPFFPFSVFTKPPKRLNGENLSASHCTSTEEKRIEYMWGSLCERRIYKHKEEDGLLEERLGDTVTRKRQWLALGLEAGTEKNKKSWPRATWNVRGRGLHVRDKAVLLLDRHVGSSVTAATQLQSLSRLLRRQSKDVLLRCGAVY